jgi:hypothetical protein
LELVGKIVVGVAAIAYAIGVFLVSSDLAQYKVSDFSLTRPQYVFAGAAWLVTTAVAIGPPFLMAMYVKFGDFGRRTFGRIYFAVVSVIFCGFILTEVIKTLMPSVLVLSVMPYTTLAESIFLAIAWANLPSVKEVHANHDKEDKVSLVPSGIGFGIVALVFWTAAYNIHIFPNVEPSLGGGKHPKAHIVFCQPKEGQELQLKKMLGPNFTTDKSLTIVLVDGDFVVLANEDDTEKGSQQGNRPIWKVVLGKLFLENSEPKYKTVLVKKSLVASILYD